MVRKFIALFQTGFLFLPLLAAGQNSLDFRQFYFNPYLFNPAYVGESGHTEFSLAHRQQWADFTDSPVATGFTVQHPFKTRMALGFNFFTQNSVAMRTSQAQFTFGYTVPIKSNQSLRFALSGGLGIDDLDLEGRDYSNDPLILQAAQNSVYGQGSFGFLYSLGKLKFGFTLPTLFNRQETGSGVLETHPLEQLVNQLYTVHYTFTLKDKRFSVEPYALFRLNRDFQNYVEVAAMVHYLDRFSGGLSYHQYSGVGIFLGMTFKENYRLSYGYEIPRGKYTASGAHEFQLSIRLKKISQEPEQN